jgi:sugar/nucleoside kinase (ribokinase family)
MHAFDVIVPGHFFCDLIFTGLPEFPRLGAEVYSEHFALVPGGGALNTAIALQRLGVKVGWAGALGNDFFSQAVSRYIQSENLASDLVIHLDRPLRRVTVALSYPSDRAFVSYVDPPLPEIELVKGVLEKAHSKLIHMSGLTIHEDMPRLMDAFHKQGTQIAMECQHRDETLDSPMVRDILARLDFFMPNAAEARQLTNKKTTSEALSILSSIIPCVVVKDGAQGAAACCGGKTYMEAALKVTPIDTTGAGDVFNAGFFAAYLDGQSIPECLRWGNYCGAQSTLGFGGSSAPTRTRLKNWLASNGQG